MWWWWSMDNTFAWTLTKINNELYCYSHEFSYHFSPIDYALGGGKNSFLFASKYCQEKVPAKVLASKVLEITHWSNGAIMVTWSCIKHQLFSHWSFTFCVLILDKMLLHVQSWNFVWFTMYHTHAVAAGKLHFNVNDIHSAVYMWALFKISLLDVC